MSWNLHEENRSEREAVEAVVAPCREGEGTDKAYGVENVDSGSEIEDVRLQLTV